ncbi:porin [Pelagibacterales bacterium SAG-MED16]|nr:porin [Pelagibacterales bacterium SAG-MED16]
MNNLKKIGLTALGTAMVATSANAAELSVSGATSIFFGGEDNSNAGNGWSMTDQIDFNASGEMDNGFTVDMYLQFDSGSSLDDKTLAIGMGDMGTLTFSGHGGNGPVGAWDDKTPSANEESWGTSIGGTVDGPTNSAVSDNSFIYDYTVTDGLALKAAYKPSKGTALESSTEIGVSYTGMEGLTVLAAMGENNSAADKIDLSVFSVNYAMGPITVGFQSNESDRGTGTDEDFSAYGISYAVSDDLSISYGVSSLDYSSSLEDQDSSAVSVSFTAGGVGISASHQTTDNVAGAATADNSAYEINFSFAF